jgi:hypothetical protein
MFKERSIEVRQGTARRQGTLIGFGSMWEELSTGVGQTTTAIVLLSIGHVIEVPLDEIWVL